jgi:hypothetical protein
MLPKIRMLVVLVLEIRGSSRGTVTGIEIEEKETGNVIEIIDGQIFAVMNAPE